MSSHYTFQMVLRVRVDLTPVEVDLIRYVLNGEGQKPTTLPQHRCVSRLPAGGYFRRAYRDYPPGRYQSVFWQHKLHEGGAAEAGITLLLPGLKLEEVFGDELLSLAQWLASLSISSGHVGSITCEDDGKGIPDLLFVNDGQLHYSKAPQDLETQPIDTCGETNNKGDNNKGDGGI